MYGVNSTSSTSSFFDIGFSSYYIQSFIVRSGVWVDGVQLTYTNGKSSYSSSVRGGTGGGVNIFNIPTGQYISIIYVCFSSPNIQGFKFTTNLGLVSSMFGGTAGTCSNVTIPAPGLLGIGGYSGTFLNGIFFIY